MTHIIGRGVVVGDTHLWNGTNWSNGADNIAADNGVVEKQVMGWGALADTRYALTTTVFTGVAGTSLTGAFWDGRDIWLCDNGTGTQSVYRVNWEFGKSDLTVNAALLGLGSINPYDAGYDGDFTNMYFTSLSTNQVIKFNRGTGAIIGTALSLTGPKRILYDGEKLWISRGTVVTRIDSFTVPTTVDVSGFTAAEYMVFDGRFIWVSDTGTTNLVKIDPYPGTPTIVATFSLATRPVGLTFDGTSVYAVSDTGNAVYAVNVLTSAQTTIDVSGLLSSPTIAAFDGYFVVVADSTNHVKINPATGRVLRGATYSGGGSAFMTSIGQGSLIIGNGTTMKRGDLPQSGVFMQLGRDTTVSSGGRGTASVNGASGVPSGPLTYNIGTTGATANMPADKQDAQIIHITGSITANVRIDPTGSSTPNGIWHIFNDVTLNAHTLTFGSSVSSINLGTQGTHTIVISNAGFVILNQF